MGELRVFWFSEDERPDLYALGHGPPLQCLALTQHNTGGRGSDVGRVG